MNERILLDSDVLIKSCSYALEMRKAGKVFASLQYHALSVVKFVVPKRLNKTGMCLNVDAALLYFERNIKDVRLLDPTSDELKLAAEIELYAQRRNIEFHVGESQLLAILLVRNFDQLLTGDKKAVKALPLLALGFACVTNARKKIVCFEQLVLCLLKAGCVVDLRERICSCPQPDKSLSLCFSCNSSVKADSEYAHALQSYINDIRRTSDSFLVDQEYLLPVPSQENSVGRD